MERLYNGIIKENPIFVLLLGLCPTLAVTSSTLDAVGMGLATTVVLFMCNVIISLLRGIIPYDTRIPAFIVIAAGFSTVVQLILEAYIPSLNKSLGIYIPLIVVNCIILGRVEAFAYKNKVGASALDGLGMGLGFTIALALLGAFRELLGAGTILEGTDFTVVLIPENYRISIFVLAPGAFFVLAALTAIQNKIKIKKGKDPKQRSCISGSSKQCVKMVPDSKSSHCMEHAIVKEDSVL